MSQGQRIAILTGILVAAAAGVLFLDPIPQDPAYHRFADSRTFFGVANFADVATNAAFAVAGMFGLATIFGRGGDGIFAQPLDRRPYIVFFIGVAAVSVGSAYYHAAPDSERLVWDRLPMTIAFMSLFAAFVADRINARAGIVYLLPVLIALGLLSVFHWDWTETQGRGDLRFYALVQFCPIVALPVLCWLFPRSHHTGGRHLGWIIVCYAAAKGFETYDHEVFALLGNAISGHSIKHLLSALAVYLVLRMVADRRI